MISMLENISPLLDEEEANLDMHQWRFVIKVYSPITIIV